MLSCRTRADHQIKISSSSTLDVTTSDSSNDSNNKIQEKKQRKIKKEIKIIKERGGERERIVEKRISEVKRASKVLRLSQGDNVSFHLISFRFVSFLSLGPPKLRVVQQSTLNRPVFFHWYSMIVITMESKKPK